MSDLLPVFWTAASWEIPVMREGQGSGVSDEEGEVLGGADRLRAEAEDGTSVGEVCRKTGDH